jgi:hypothetical protein
MISSKHTNSENKKEETIYTCDKCYKQYKTKKYLIEHEKICIGVNKLTCQKCMFEFTRASAKSKHIKNNNCKPRSIIFNKNTNNDKIHINNFKNERTDYITLENILQFLEDEDLNTIISKYIELKHFNTNFPENCNIKFLKFGSCIVKKDNDWTLQLIDDITDILYNLNYEEMYNILKEQLKLHLNKNECKIILKIFECLNDEHKIHNIKLIKKLIKLHVAENTNVNNYKTCI